MIDATKEIVIALINSKQICSHADSDKNIEDVQKAIKEVYKSLLKTKTISVTNND